MTNSKTWTIDQTNPIMCEWAYKYLYNHFDLPPRVPFQNDYWECVEFFRTLGSESQKLLTIKMQAAWRQKQHRDKQSNQGRKPCSFILSSGSLIELKKLAKDFGEPLNTTLERIINGTYLEDKENKKLTRKNTKLTIPQ